MSCCTYTYITIDDLGSSLAPITRARWKLKTVTRRRWSRDDMSRTTQISAAVGLVALLVNTGCVATKAQLRHVLEGEAQDRTQQERELQTALNAERMERLASDQSLAAELGTLNSDLAM